MLIYRVRDVERPSSWAAKSLLGGGQENTDNLGEALSSCYFFRVFAKTLGLRSHACRLEASLMWRWCPCLGARSVVWSDNLWSTHHNDGSAFSMQTCPGMLGYDQVWASFVPEGAVSGSMDKPSISSKSARQSQLWLPVRALFYPHVWTKRGFWILRMYCHVASCSHSTCDNHDNLSFVAVRLIQRSLPNVDPAI